ncbi:hypothetical protein ABFB50_01050 [Dehalococcoides sp. THU3]|uniref:hypothetical protein n=1 Tax=Dehalococcoides TaxID=61434 RepID=UPI0032187E80
MKQVIAAGAIFIVCLFAWGFISGDLTGGSSPSGTVPSNTNTNNNQSATHTPSLIKTISGSGDLTSAVFTIPEDTWEIRWSYVPENDMCIIYYFVYDQSTSLPVDMKTYSSYTNTSGTNYLYSGSGSYHISVTAANISSWTLQIYA